MEKIKETWKLVTVKIALAAAVLALVSLYLPWYTRDNLSQTIMQAIKERPDYSVGALPVVVIGALWTAAFFLLNHPKLTLFGDAALIFMFLAFVMEASGRGISLGMGAYLYAVMVIALIVCAFATKKIRKA